MTQAERLAAYSEAAKDEARKNAGLAQQRRLDGSHWADYWEAVAAMYLNLSNVYERELQNLEFA